MTQAAEKRVVRLDESDPGTQHLRVRNIQELLAADFPPRDHIVSPIIPVKGTAMLFAKTGVGKTFVALTIAQGVAAGGPCLGDWHAPEPRRVLVVDGEMPMAVLQKRLAEITAGSEKQPPDPDYLRILASDDQELGIPDLSTKAGQAALEPFLDGIALLILDNISTLFPSSKENETDGWKAAQGWLLSLRRRGISVLLVHHAGKGGMQRGASGREDVLDTVIQLSRPEDYAPEEGARFEVRLTKARGIIGADAEPFEARLTADDHGTLTWITATLEDTKLTEVADLLNEGRSIRAVAKEVGLSKSQVQRMKTQAAEKGLLDV